MRRSRALLKKHSERTENTTPISVLMLSKKQRPRTKRVPDVGFLLEFPLFCDDSAVLIVRTSGEPVSHRLGWILVEYTELTDTCRTLHRPPRDTGFFRMPVSMLYRYWFWPQSGYDALSQRALNAYTEMVLFSNTKMLIFSEFSELSTLLGNYTVLFRAYQRLIVY